MLERVPGIGGDSGPRLLQGERCLYHPDPFRCLLPFYCVPGLASVCLGLRTYTLDSLEGALRAPRAALPSSAESWTSQGTHLLPGQL